MPWQRCQFHLQQNANAYVTRLNQRKPVAQRIRAIFNAPDRAEAERLLKQAIAIWQVEAPKLAQWAEGNLPEGLTVFDQAAGSPDPAANHQRPRTHQPRDQAPNTRRVGLPQLRLVPATRLGFARRVR